METVRLRIWDLRCIEYRGYRGYIGIMEKKLETTI